jgi:hypothetical protein
LRRAEGGAKNFGAFRVKNHDYTQHFSIIDFSSFNFTLLVEQDYAYGVLTPYSTIFQLYCGAGADPGDIQHKI